MKNDPGLHWRLGNWGRCARQYLEDAGAPPEYANGARWQKDVLHEKGSYHFEPDGDISEIDHDDAETIQRGLELLQTRAHDNAIFLKRFYRDRWQFESVDEIILERTMRHARRRLWAYL